jgi:hypothetical protein
VKAVSAHGQDAHASPLTQARFGGQRAACLPGNARCPGRDTRIICEFSRCSPPFFGERSESGPGRSEAKPWENSTSTKIQSPPLLGGRQGATEENGGLVCRVEAKKRLPKRNERMDDSTNYFLYRILKILHGPACEKAVHDHDYV